MCLCYIIGLIAFLVIFILSAQDSIPLVGNIIISAAIGVTAVLISLVIRAIIKVIF